MNNIFLFVSNDIVSSSYLQDFIRKNHEKIGMVFQVSQVKSIKQVYKLVTSGVSLKFLGYKAITSRTDRNTSKLCTKHSIPFAKTNNINEDFIKQMIQMFEPDYCLCFQQQIIKPELLKLAKFVNAHGSLLPKYKGPAQYFWYKYNGDKTGGVTLHEMTKNIDKGKIIGQKKFEIDEFDTMISLHHIISETAFALFDDFVNKRPLKRYKVKDDGKYLMLPTTREMGLYCLNNMILWPKGALKALWTIITNMERIRPL